MVNIDSLHPIMESCPDKDDTYGRHVFVEKVFMAEVRAAEELLRMPIPGDSLSEKALDTLHVAKLGRARMRGAFE